MSSETYIRATARAVICKGPLVLVQVKQSLSGHRYLTLPGGRQEFGETMQDCVARECVEEIGVVPVVGDVLHVADIIRSSPRKTRHLAEVLFACTVPESYCPQMGVRPDKRQIDTIWADPAALGEQFLPRYDMALTRGDAPVYLGRIDCETP